MRPPFARDYPESPEIEALLTLFESGNYAGLRDAAKKLEAHDSKDVRLAAKDLVRRTQPDPAMVWIFLGILAMILAISGYWLTRG